MTQEQARIVHIPAGRAGEWQLWGDSMLRVSHGLEGIADALAICVEEGRR